jgi:hypothetical protein
MIDMEDPGKAVLLLQHNPLIYLFSWQSTIDLFPETKQKRTIDVRQIII